MTEAPKLTQIWGLTGGIASGKSTVAKFFSEFGFPVIDADSVSRELSRAGGEAHALIVKRLGTSDRAALRELIFKDPSKRAELEAIPPSFDFPRKPQAHG
jgi:dephospho-CoA kinase